MNRLYDWIYRKLNPDVPARMSVKRYLKTAKPRYDNRVDRLWIIAIDYSLGMSVEELAWGLGVTRERIRQMLWKFYRLNRKGVWKNAMEK